MTKSANPYQERVAREVNNIISPVVAELGFELVEVIFRRESQGNVLRVVIFSDTGIGVDDCALVSREISRILDVEERIDQAYHLEVSSPGLDRPLETARDFSRYKGRQVRVVLNGTYEEVIAVIAEVDGDKVFLTNDQGQQVVLLSQLNSAKLVIGF